MHGGHGVPTLRSLTDIRRVGGLRPPLTQFRPDITSRISK